MKQENIRFDPDQDGGGILIPLRDFLENTRAELGIGAAIFGALLGGGAYSHNLAQEGHIPLAYSEVAHVAQNIRADGQQVPPLTEFYSSANDAVMRVFEANNAALQQNRHHETFARELRSRVADIDAYATAMPGQAHAALDAVAGMRAARRDIQPAMSALQNSWSYRSHDNYHTQVYTTMSCQPKGGCTTSVHTRQVYDNTDHYYTYSPAWGARAAALMSQYAATHQTVTTAEKLVTAREVSPENAALMRPTLQKQLDGKAPTSDQEVAYAASWATTSNYAHFNTIAARSNDGFNRIAPQWNAALGRAASVSYRTNSSRDSGPAAYQTVQAALAKGGALQDASAKVSGGMTTAARDVPALDAKIHQYISVVLDHHKGDAGKLRHEIMDLSRGVYTANHTGGLDLYPFKWGSVLGFAALGLGVGLGAGYAADTGVEALRQRRMRVQFDQKGRQHYTDQPKEPDLSGAFTYKQRSSGPKI